MRLHQVASHRLVDGLSRCTIQLGDAPADVLVRVDWPAVAAGEIHQGAVGLIDILHRNPDATHEALGVRTEVDRIGMEVLLGADWKV